MKEDLRLPRVVAGLQTPNQPTGRYPEAKIDVNLPQVTIRSDINSVDLFKVGLLFVKSTTVISNIRRPRLNCG